jgi:hypothetical protein
MLENKKPERTEALSDGPMHYAPENELDVVFLFAYLAKRWRLKIDEIKSGYPDCIAYQKTHGKEKRIRIEFEFKSKSFKSHRHRAQDCDWIVCWEHNWPDAPKNLNIVELRREYGLGFNVWVVPVREPYKHKLTDSVKVNWSVPSQSHKGDLVLFYFTRPDCSVNYIYKLNERATKVNAEWKDGAPDYMADIQRVCQLRAPIFIDDLRRHRVPGNTGFVRVQFQGRPNVTEYWPYLYEFFVRRNPAVKRQLNKYIPESLL